MRALHEHIRVLHDPVGYYRPWRNHADTLLPGQRAALNDWLTRHHQLPPCHDVGTSFLARRLLEGWSRVPAAAYLVACAKQRRRLLGWRGLLDQPSTVHGFLKQGFAESAVQLRELDTESLAGWGAAYMQHGLRDRLPAWMLARLALWFYGLPAPPQETLSGENASFDMTCFWSAWHHAADVPRNIA